jgi:hypothetical protein
MSVFSMMGVTASSAGDVMLLVAFDMGHIATKSHVIPVHELYENCAISAAALAPYLKNDIRHINSSLKERGMVPAKFEAPYLTKDHYVDLCTVLNHILAAGNVFFLGDSMNYFRLVYDMFQYRIGASESVLIQ